MQRTVVVNRHGGIDYWNARSSRNPKGFAVGTGEGDSPHPVRPAASSPAPPGAGAVMGDTQWKSADGIAVLKTGASVLTELQNPWTR